MGEIDPKSLEAVARAIYEANPMQRTWSRNVGETGSSIHYENIPWAEIVEDGNLPLYTEMSRAAILAFIEAEREAGRRMMSRFPTASMAAAGQYAIINPMPFPPDGRRIITAQQVWLEMFDASPDAGGERG